MIKSNIVKSRIAFADYAKVIGTFLVVFGHVTNTFDTLHLFIYSFHMPFFFFISGMFFNCSGVKFIDEVKKTTNRIFIPTLIYLTVSLVVIWFLYHDQSLFVLIKCSIHGALIGEIITVNLVCWFLFTLINLRLLTNIWFNKRWLAIILIILGLLSFYKNILFIAQTELAFPFFLLGCYMKDYIISESKKDFSIDRNIIIPITLFGICALILYFNGKMNMWRRIFGTLPYGINIIAYFISGLSGTFALVYFSFIFKNNNKYILSASNALITCVGMQFIFYTGFTRIFGLEQPYWICAIVAIIIMVVCISIHRIFSRFLPQYFR